MPTSDPSNFEIGPPDRDLYLKAGSVPYFKLSAAGLLTSVNSGSISGAAISAGTQPVSSLTAAWTTPTFAAGDYTGSGTLVATVASGDVIANAYVIIGKILFWRLELTPITISGTGTQIRVLIPGAAVAAGVSAGAYHFVDNGTGGVGLWEASNNGTVVNLFLTATSSNWAASTDATAIRASMMIAIA